MDNNTKITDLTVGQLKQLMSRLIVIRKKAPKKIIITEPESVNHEQEIILKYLTTDINQSNICKMTATEIKEYIDSVSGGEHKIQSLKVFGMQLKAIFGKSKQTRGHGHQYTVGKK